MESGGKNAEKKGKEREGKYLNPNQNRKMKERRILLSVLL